MQSHVTAASLSDDEAERFYAKGRFKAAADRYMLVAKTLPPHLAWPLRIKAVMAHLRRRDDDTRSLPAAKAIFNQLLAYTQEHQLFDVQLTEAWIWLCAGHFQRAQERSVQLAQIASSQHQLGQVRILMSQLAWLQGDRAQAHQLFDDAASWLRGRDSRHARLDNLVYNLPYLSWPNRFVMMWRGLILALQTGRHYDGAQLMKYLLITNRPFK